MSVGLLIKEGQVGRKILPVEKLKINNIGGGESYWVPEETTEVDSLDVSKNGLYYAINDDLDGYDQVNVNVPPDMDENDIAKGKKITGTGDDGNDYAYGLDENDDGDKVITVEQIPAAIHIVVPPRKLKYEEGETIDFTGIHVYLMNGNNQRYTDEDYPTGEIPFDELIFPVTKVEGGDDNVYTNGQGLFFMLAKIGPETESNAYGTFYMGPVIGYLPDDAWTGWEGGPLHAASTAEFSAYLTLYGNYIYGYGIDSLNNYFVIKVEGGLNGYGSRFSQQNWKAVDSFPDEDLSYISEIPVSEVDPLEYGDMSDIKKVSEIKIPVQWIRSDGEVLEDFYTIEVGESGEPLPPEPDPWGGYADVSYNGHHYNLNRRIVPAIHYANGYLWQEGTSEYTVDQAIDMGWLILIR